MKEEVHGVGSRRDQAEYKKRELTMKISKNPTPITTPESIGTAQ